MIILLVRDIQIGFELVCCCEPVLSLTASIMAIPSDRPLAARRALSPLPNTSGDSKRRRKACAAAATSLANSPADTDPVTGPAVP
jgi:hypothetical protein